MTYSIIGSGNIGTAVARQFARKGINVAITNHRGPDSLRLSARNSVNALSRKRLRLR